MPYSQKSFRLARGGSFAILALLLSGVVLIALLKRRPFDPTFFICLVGVLGLISSWLLLHSHRYRDEIQRRASEKRVYWGYQIGILASVPVVLLSMLPNATWLDSLVQLVSRNHPMPHFYFVIGFMLPCLFQGVATTALRLLAKMRNGEQV